MTGQFHSNCSIKIIFLSSLLAFLAACNTVPTKENDKSTPEPDKNAATDSAPDTQDAYTKNSSQATPTKNSAPTEPTTTNNSSSLTSEEQTQQLDQQLDERFADFDRLLLREHEFLKEQQNEQGAPQSATSGGGGGSVGSGLDGIDDYGPLADEGTAANGDPPGTQQNGGGNAFPSDNTNINIPPDLVNSKGDDVIARQLREAAMKEKDPELREKLWNEYRKYKSGI